MTIVTAEPVSVLEMMVSGGAKIIIASDGPLAEKLAYQIATCRVSGLDPFSDATVANVGCALTLAMNDDRMGPSQLCPTPSKLRRQDEWALPFGWDGSLPIRGIAMGAGAPPPDVLIAGPIRQIHGVEPVTVWRTSLEPLSDTCQLLWSDRAEIPDEWIEWADHAVVLDQSGGRGVMLRIVRGNAHWPDRLVRSRDRLRPLGAR